MAGRSKELLIVKDLQTCFFTTEGTLKAVDRVSFSLNRGETLGIVGESGSGKTITALSILGIIPRPGKIVSGEIVFDGENLCKKSDKAMRNFRGNRIAMISQDPMTSLNPVYRIGNQVGEPLVAHRKPIKDHIRTAVVDMLEKVKIPSPAMRIKEYPHQFSGGMKQRSMIAMSLICQPELLIADEPTTALDVTIQAQVLYILKELQAEFQTSIIFITHDLGVVAGICTHVAVMYAGNIIEKSDLSSIFKQPRHPYTRGLLASLPKTGRIQDRLPTIEGQPPDLLKLPKGCRFSPRCPYSQEQCFQKEPITEQINAEHEIRCFRWREL